MTGVRRNASHSRCASHGWRVSCMTAGADYNCRLTVHPVIQQARAAPSGDHRGEMEPAAALRQPLLCFIGPAANPVGRPAVLLLPGFLSI